MDSSSQLNAENGVASLVSVIIPAYNAARYIKETLDSVFAQTYKEYQVIVVNDGSPDTIELEKVLSPCMNRITYIKQENRGLAGARNTGLRAAKGSLVAFLDADDIWMPDYLVEQSRFLRDHPQYDLVYCNAQLFGDSPHDGVIYMTAFPSNGEATAAAIISRKCHVFVSVLARMSAIAPIAFDESLRCCEDFDCWIRFTASGHRIGYHRKVLVGYRKHSESLSAVPARMAEFSIKVFTKSLSLWPEGSPESDLLLEARAQKVAELETIRSKLALMKRDHCAAIEHLQAANTYYKSSRKSAVILILRIAPDLVVWLARLRAFLFRTHREV